MSSPGVVMMFDFVMPQKGSGSFANYIKYMARLEAFIKKDSGSLAQVDHKGLFDGYVDYMRNDDKTDGLFTATIDKVDLEKQNQLKDAFVKSQSLGCPLYRGVISFNNDFLKELGLYSGSPDLYKIKEVTRAAVETIAAKSHLDNLNITWTGAIHTNTDNVHVHLAISENEYKKRRFDKLPIEAIDSAKSVVANKLIGSEEAIIRTQLVREKLLPEFKKTSATAAPLFLVELMDRLPEGPKWLYGAKGFEPYRQHVDTAVNYLISCSPKLSQSFEDYVSRLDAFASKAERIYGTGSRNLAGQTKENRLADFYNRAGNILLKELQREDQQNSFTTSDEPAIDKKTIPNPLHGVSEFPIKTNSKDAINPSIAPEEKLHSQSVSRSARHIHSEACLSPSMQLSRLLSAKCAVAARRSQRQYEKRIKELQKEYEQLEIEKGRTL